MEARALHALHALASPAFPTGAFAYSHGLETAMADGRVRTAEDARAWIDGVLCHGAGRNDAILLVAAARAADEAARDAVSALAEALAASAERHEETMAQGRAAAETAARLYGTDPSARPLPIVWGQVVVAQALPLGPAVDLYLHGFVANLVSAATRFLPLGQTEGQRVLHALFPAMEAVAVAALGAGLDDLGGAAFAAELDAFEHETLQPRIFRT